MELLTSLRLRIVLSFVLAAGILGSSAYLLYDTAQQNQKTRNSIFQTRSEIIVLQGLLTVAQDAETGQRGLASFPVPPESVEEMVQQADALMYLVKLRGKEFDRNRLAKFRRAQERRIPLHR